MSRRSLRLAALAVPALVLVLAAALVLPRLTTGPGPGQRLQPGPGGLAPIVAADLAIDGGLALPEPSSPADHAELDELVALQATRTPDQLAVVAAWDGPAVIERWNRELLQGFRDARLNPVRAARALALLNVAMHDAVAASTRLLDPSRPAPAARDARIRPLPTAGTAAAAVAASAAAERVLRELLPDSAERAAALADEVAMACLWAAVGTRSEMDAARRIGEAAGASVMARARDDGADRTWDGAIPADPDGWTPQVAQQLPMEPMAGTWRTWLLTSGDELRPPPPPALDSDELRRDAEELVAIRAALTPEQVEQARFWADGAGTVTPAGHWTLIALDLAQEAGLDLVSLTRLTAYLGMVQADAFIACWEAKYAYWYARPIQRIPGFVSAIPTPPFPAYPSGHATQSAAAAVFLAAVFPDAADELLAMADAASESRILAGIHWRVDATAGVALGTAIGERAAERLAEAR